MNKITHSDNEPRKSLFNNILGHFKFTLLRNILNIPIDFLNTIIIARLLGPESNGKYAIIMLFASFLLTASSFSIGSANIYFINSKLEKLKTVYNFNLLFWILATLTNGVLLIISTLTPFDAFIESSQNITLIWLIVSSTMLQSMLGSLIQSLQLFTSFNSIILLTSITRITINIIYFYTFKNISAEIIIHLYIYTQFIISLITWITLRKHIENSETNFHHIIKYGKKSFSFSLKSHANNLVSFINDRLDTYIINIKMGATHTGYYHIGSLLAQRLWVVSDSMSLVVYPILSQLYANETNDKANTTATLGRICLLLTLILAIALSLIIYPFILLAFGEAYLPAANTVLALLPGIVFGSLGRIIANALSAAGQPQINFKISSLSIIISTSLNIILIPHLQSIGAALATSIAWGICTLVWLSVFARINHISIKVLLTPNRSDFRAIISMIQRFKR